jgi:hypothetical protein
LATFPGGGASSERDMQEEPNVATKYRHTEWNVTFVIWAYRKITKVEAAMAVKTYLDKNKNKALMRGSRVPILTNLR